MTLRPFFTLNQAIWKAAKGSGLSLPVRFTPASHEVRHGLTADVL